MSRIESAEDFCHRLICSAGRAHIISDIRSRDEAIVRAALEKAAKIADKIANIQQSWEANEVAISIRALKLATIGAGQK